MKGRLEVGQDARKTLFEFLRWNVVSALRDTHRHTLFGYSRTRRADKAHDRVVARLRHILEEGQLLTHRVGEDGLENKALPVTNQFAPDGAGHAGGRIRFDPEFTRQH